ncbi:MAG: hypothetical protein ABIW50_07725 [Candidatus Limnocylindria bacterium]
MARTILIIATAAWALAGLAGLGIAAVGTEALHLALPELAIDRAALGGAVTAVALSALGVAILHLAALLGIRRRWRAALASGVLLGAVMTMLSAALCAAAVASAVRTPDYLAILGAACLAGSLAAVGYGFVTAALVRDLRSDSGT